MPGAAVVRAGRQRRLQRRPPAEIPAHHAQSVGGDHAAGRLRQGSGLCRLHTLTTRTGLRTLL